MSLLTDPSYLIYQMRLALINNDQTAKKIVTLPIYSEDDYLVYSNSPEDNTYSTSPNITMMGGDLYQTKKGKSPYSPFLNSSTTRSQFQQSQTQSSKTIKSTKSSQNSSNNIQPPPPPQRNDTGKKFTLVDSKTKMDVELDKQNSNINNASTISNKNSNNSNTNATIINSSNKNNDLMDDNEHVENNVNIAPNSNVHNNNHQDSNSCRSTNSLQLEDEEEEAEYNDTLSSSNESKDKGPMEAPVITENLFVKQKHILTLDGGRFVPTGKPLVSNLSQLLKQNSNSSNPFADYRFFVTFFYIFIIIIIIYIYFLFSILYYNILSKI